LKKNYLYLDIEKRKEIDAYLEASGGEFATDNQEKEYDRLDWSIDANVVDYIKAWKEKKALIDSIKAEITRMKDYLDAEVKRQESIEQSLRFALDDRHTESLDYGINSVSLCNVAPSLPPAEEIEDMVPDAYRIEIPATSKVDRRLLLKGVKAGDVFGIELITDKKRLKVS